MGVPHRNCTVIVIVQWPPSGGLGRAVMGLQCIKSGVLASMLVLMFQFHAWLMLIRVSIQHSVNRGQLSI